MNDNWITTAEAATIISKHSHHPIQARLHETIENDSDDVLSKLLHIQLCLPDLRLAAGKRVTKARAEDL